MVKPPGDDICKTVLILMTFFSTEIFREVFRVSLVLKPAGFTAGV